jgi:hypothetical protein
MDYNTKCANITLLDRLALSFNEAKIRLEKSDESHLTVCRTYKRETVCTLNTQTQYLATFSILLSAHRLYLCILYGSEKKQRLYFPKQHKLVAFYNRDGLCLLRGTD